MNFRQSLRENGKIEQIKKYSRRNYPKFRKEGQKRKECLRDIEDTLERPDIA
jgi:hypothetical protein